MTNTSLNGFQVLYHRYEEIDEIAKCKKCGTCYHGNRTVMIDKEGHTCSGENEYSPDSIDIIKDMPRTPMKRIIYTMPDKAECDRIIKEIQTQHNRIKEENGQTSNQRVHQEAEQDS